MVKELDLSTIDGIVISSGDGLIYEVKTFLTLLSVYIPFSIGGEWVNGATRLANSYKDTYWSATHWIRQCAGYYHNARSRVSEGLLNL